MPEPSKELTELIQQIKTALHPEFPPGGVPVEVAAKAYGIALETLRHQIEFKEINIGRMWLSPAKRGKRRYRNFYISPKLLYEETGYMWKGEQE